MFAQTFEVQFSEWFKKCVVSGSTVLQNSQLLLVNTAKHPLKGHSCNRLRNNNEQSQQQPSIWHHRCNPCSLITNFCRCLTISVQQTDHTLTWVPITTTVVGRVNFLDVKIIESDSTERAGNVGTCRNEFTTHCTTTDTIRDNSIVRPLT